MTEIGERSPAALYLALLAVAMLVWPIRAAAAEAQAAAGFGVSVI